MKKSLLTYEQAQFIVENNDSFYESVFNIMGYKVSIFNYRLAQYSDFIEPIKGGDLKAHELRGMTYVFNNDGTLFQRYLMLTKFFNIDQVDESFYANIVNKKVKNVMNKEDGSLVSFVKFPDGSVRARTKASFTSEQSIEAGRVYNNSTNIQKLVNWGFDNDIVFFFEYVSPFNRIVLKYYETDLVLLRGRNNITGEYIDVSTIDTFGVSVADFEYHTIDELISLAQTTKDKEGWVIEFEDGAMVKVKTAWYFTSHKLMTDSLNRECDIIRLIINDEIDDILTQLDVSDNDIRDHISEIGMKVKQEFFRIRKEVNLLIEKYNEDKTNFGRNFNKYEFFCLAKQVAVHGGKMDDVIGEHIIKITNKLGKAREWLKNIKLL